MDGINQLWLIVLIHHQQCFLVHLAIIGTYLLGQQHSIERGMSKRIFKNSNGRNHKGFFTETYYEILMDNENAAFTTNGHTSICMTNLICLSISIALPIKAAFPLPIILSTIAQTT